MPTCPLGTAREAVGLAEKNLAASVRGLGTRHPRAIIARADFALILLAAGRTSEALSHCVRAAHKLAMKYSAVQPDDTLSGWQLAAKIRSWPPGVCTSLDQQGRNPA